jgi:hypothetical protein
MRRSCPTPCAYTSRRDPLVAGLPWPVYTQPTSVRPYSCPSAMLDPLDDLPPSTQIETLIPAHACPAVAAVREAFQAVPAWTDHLEANASLKARDRASRCRLWHGWARQLGQLRQS